MTFVTDMDPEITALSTYESEHILQLSRKLIGEGSCPLRVVEDLAFVATLIAHEHGHDLHTSAISKAVIKWSDAARSAESQNGKIAKH
ncbi:MAG: hypothetical protein AAFR27_10075 [Pseudomonadota bacterium]